MKLYMLQDSNGWVSDKVYNTYQEAKKRAKEYLKRPAWEDTKGFAIFELNSITKIVTKYRVLRDDDERDDLPDESR